MNRNNIKQSLDSFNLAVNKNIEQAIQDMQISIPVKVTERNQLTVSVQSLITFGGLDYLKLSDIPIIKNRYFHYPVAVDDFGLLIPISFFYASLVTDSVTEIATKTPSSFISNFLFLPISQLETDLSGDDFTDYSGMSSPSGDSNENIYDDKIELLGPDDTNITIESNNITIAKSDTDLITITDSEIDIQNSGGYYIKVTSSGIEINGNTDYAVKHTLLNTALQAEVTLINAQLSAIAASITTIIAGVTALGYTGTLTPYTYTPVTLDISGAQDAEVKL